MSLKSASQNCDYVFDVFEKYFRANISKNPLTLKREGDRITFNITGYKFILIGFHYEDTLSFSTFEVVGLTSLIDVRVECLMFAVFKKEVSDFAVFAGSPEKHPFPECMKIYATKLENFIRSKFP